MPQAVKNILYVLAGAVTLLAIYLAMKYVVPEAFSWLGSLLAVLFPFLLAAIFSIFMEPVVILFSNKGKISRIIAVPAAMIVFFGVIGTALTLIILRLVKELNDLSAMLPQKVEEAQYLIDIWVKKGVLFYGTLPKSVTSNLHEAIYSVTVNIQHWARDLVNSLLYVLSGIPGAIMIIIISLIATYFFSKDREKIIEMWLRLVPPPWGERVLAVSRQVAGAFQSYVRAQFILITITTTISIIGLYFIGTEYALTLGLIIGFFDMIPVLGPGTIYIPWAAWSFVTSNVMLGLKLTALYLLVMVVRAVLEAKVVAANLGLHPLAVLIAMYVGLKTLGVLGLIIGPILVIAIQATIRSGNYIHK
ncbi:sporulation integral membrane protein YtvI [Desulfoscipio geothermicus]|uniref:Sporulation integral membrane protein YtvI n=1 Tax=Desulfoscipio geothermicus DSM 3669 TaxID=1121426 RepID=A0A1I6D8C0_9FIRM|nr:sporulation integral membrane protein YtvI [Desulfoscipio geothermicus]SFR01673.1 sporulation integral membrane protein YtvI [Desulfoscipio geothermicus DSM 3669]